MEPLRGLRTSTAYFNARVVRGYHSASRLLSRVSILTGVKVRNHGLVLQSDPHPSSTCTHTHRSTQCQYSGVHTVHSCTTVTEATHHAPRRCWILNFLLPSSWFHYRTDSSRRGLLLLRGRCCCRCPPGLCLCASPEPLGFSPASPA